MPDPRPQRALLRPVALAAASIAATAPLTAHTAGAQSPTTPGTVAGVVRDSAGHAITAATVALGDALPLGVDARDATFAFRGVGAASLMVHVRAVGYAPLDTLVVVRSGAAVTLTLVLARVAQALAGVRVDATAPAAPARRKAGSSVLITRAQIGERAPARFSDLLRRVPGVTMYPVATPYGTTEYTYVMRGVATVKGQTCPIAYFVDGVPADASDGVDRLVSPALIDSLEVFQAGSQAPARFSAGTTGRCGVIAIWTRAR